jgi:hypothetical protein
MTIIYLILFLILGFCVFGSWEFYRTDKLNKITQREIAKSIFEVGVILKSIMANMTEEEVNKINEKYKNILSEINNQ